MDFKTGLPIVISSISLIWSFFNTKYSITVSKKLRKNAVNLEEFRAAVRDPINSALSDCEALGKIANGFSVSSKSLTDSEDEVRDLNKSMIAAFSKLSDYAENADGSAFCSKKGFIEAVELKEEIIQSLFNEGLNTVHDDLKRKDALRKVAATVRDLRVVLKSMIDVEIESLSK